MKRYTFDMDGMYVFYLGKTLGEALQKFVKDYPERISWIMLIRLTHTAAKTY